MNKMKITHIENEDGFGQLVEKSNPSPTTMKECNCKKAELKGYISTNCPVHCKPSEEKECENCSPEPNKQIRTLPNLNICADCGRSLIVPKQDWEERLKNYE